jgi:integrase
MTERTTATGAARYQARWFDGTRWRAKTFATADEAEDHLRGIGRRKRGGRYAPETDLTVAELVAAYLDRGAHRWTANTVATYALLLRTQIAPWLGSARATELTPARVQAWLDRRTGQVSASVLGTARTVLSGAYREAVRLGMVAVNPVTGTQPPARPRRQATTWTPVQIGRVLDAARADVALYARYLVALTTGVRPGELRALMWADVDLDAGVLTVRRTMTRDARFRHVVGATTKTGRSRTVALTAEAVDALRAHRAAQNARRLAAPAWAERPVIFDRGDGHPLAQQTASNQHRALCTRAGVPVIRQHDLRHVAATLLIELGVPLKVVSDMLGHASVATTADIYGHPGIEIQRDAVTKLGDAILPNRHKA